MLTRIVARLVRGLRPSTRRALERAWWAVRPAGFLFVLVSLWSFASVTLMSEHDWPLSVWFSPWTNAFIVFLAVDYLVGTEEGRARPFGVPDAWAPVLRWIPVLALPLYAMVVVLGARMTALDASMGVMAKLGWMTACGLCGGFHAIVAAHELIHRRSRWERVAGGLLSSLVGYATFKVEHIRGHHVDVGTDSDPSSARRGQGVYAFVPRAFVLNVVKAFRLEAARLRKAGRSPWSPRNELIWWTAATTGVGASLALAYGPWALAFFVVQAAMSIWLIEAANYVEHYGLRRRKLAEGRYERVAAAHSWDSAYLPSSWLILAVPRHARHHLRPSLPYYELEAERGSPRLPGGYSAMILLAHVPPLWRSIIDPRLPAIPDTAPGSHLVVGPGPVGHAEGLRPSPAPIGASSGSRGPAIEA